VSIFQIQQTCVFSCSA